MEKKPVYSVGVDMAKDGAKDRTVERKPVFCAHNPLPMSFMTRPEQLRCSRCGVEWFEGQQPGQIIIGFVEAGEDGGK